MFLTSPHFLIGITAHVANGAHSLGWIENDRGVDALGRNREGTCLFRGYSTATAANERSVKPRLNTSGRRESGGNPVDMAS